MMKYLYCIGLVVVSFVLLLTGCQSGDVDKEIETYDQLSEYYIKNNRPDSAVLVKLKTIELIDTLDRSYVPVLARTYNDLGDLFYNVAVFDKSREMYACAFALQCRSDGQKRGITRQKRRVAQLCGRRQNDG